MADEFESIEQSEETTRRRWSSLVGVSPTSVISGASIGGVVLLWHLVSVAGVVSSQFLVSPLTVVGELGTLLRYGYIEVPLYVHIGHSIARSVAGLFAAIVLAVPVGLFMGHNRYASAALLPLIAICRPVPAIALIPLVVLWFGIGEFAKVFLIFLAAFLYISLSVAHGVREVKESLIRAAYSLGVNERQLFFHVIFPETLPNIVNAIKVGAAISWTVVVAAELVAAQKGLGYLIMDAATFFRINDVYSGIVVIGFVGFGLEYLIRCVESRLVHWSGK